MITYLPSGKSLPADIMRVAKNYLTSDNRTVGILIPLPPRKEQTCLPALQQKIGSSDKGGFMILKTVKNSFYCCSFIFSLLLVLQEKDLHAMPPVQKTVLPNRLVILHSEDHSLPFVTLELLIDGGSRRDPAGTGRFGAI